MIAADVVVNILGLTFGEFLAISMFVVFMFLILSGYNVAIYGQLSRLEGEYEFAKFNGGGSQTSTSANSNATTLDGIA